MPFDEAGRIVSDDRRWTWDGRQWSPTGIRLPTQHRTLPRVTLIVMLVLSLAGAAAGVGFARSASSTLPDSTLAMQLCDAPQDSDLQALLHGTVESRRSVESRYGLQACVFSTAGDPADAVVSVIVFDDKAALQAVSNGTIDFAAASGVTADYPDVVDRFDTAKNVAVFVYSHHSDAALLEHFRAVRDAAAARAWR